MKYEKLAGYSADEALQPILLHKGDRLVLQSRAAMRYEDMEKDKKWLNDVMGIDAVIIDSKYGVVGIESENK